MFDFIRQNPLKSGPLHEIVILDQFNVTRNVFSLFIPSKRNWKCYPTSCSKQQQNSMHIISTIPLGNHTSTLRWKKKINLCLMEVLFLLIISILQWTLICNLVFSFNFMVVNVTLYKNVLSQKVIKRLRI